MYKIPYNTRDADGKDIVKEVEIKQFKQHPSEFQCPHYKKMYPEFFAWIKERWGEVLT